MNSYPAPLTEVVMVRAVLLTLCLAVPTFGGDDAVTRSAKSGKWSDPATWESKLVPGAGDRVLIREGHRVLYDVNSTAVIRGVSIAGVLSFDPSRDTRLEVGVVKIQAGDEYSEEGFDCEARGTVADPTKPQPTLEVGTPDRPIDATHTAIIRLHFIPGMNKESTPAIVCCGGRWESHGAPLNRSWVKLGATASVGDTAVSLAEPVTGWKPGDRIVITGTQTHGPAKTESTSEERTIATVTGDRVTFTEPLKMRHLGEDRHRAEVANLSRNVIVESADPDGERGHTMFHHDSKGSFSYSEFRYLGKKNILGRYSLHFHLVGDTMRGASVVGCSIHDSHNRWLTIHGTNYLIVRDNVGYKSIGHGYFFEDGTEVYNVLDRNLAILAETGRKLPKQVLPFDQNLGAGFWWANSLNTFTRNVAAECDEYGFRYEATQGSSLKLEFPILQPDGSRRKTDIRTLPFVRFEDNEAHSSHGLYGMNLGEGVRHVGPDTRHPFIVKNLTIWDVHYGFRPQVPSLLVENLHLDQIAYGVYHPDYNNHVYRNVYIGHAVTEPFNRGHDDRSEQFGPLTVDGLTFEACRSGEMPLIQISDHNPTGEAVSHFRNVKTVNWGDNRRSRSIVNLGGGPRPEPKTEKPVPIFLHDWFGQGRTAEILSTKTRAVKENPNDYHAVTDLTGSHSRAKEVHDVPFPELLTPVDDLPPTTVITHTQRKGDKLLVHGSTADNGTVTQVTVNGVSAKALRENFAEWEISIPSKGVVTLEAGGEDAAGNKEQLRHRVKLQ